MKIKIILFVSIAILTISSCKDEVPLAPIKSGSVADFPSAVGLSWRYQVIDNLQEPISENKPFLIVDTFNVAIAGVVTDPLSGVNATVWNYQRNNIPLPSRPVFIKSDTVYMYWSWEQADKIGIVFPFAYKDTWTTGGILSGDRTTVIDTTSMNTGIGYFKNVFVLENTRRTTISTDSRTITMWFVPKFGVLKYHVHEEHQDAIGDTTWTLFEHNNPDF